MKYIITTDHEEQGWLDAFNNELSCGRAIRLIEQEG